MDFTAQIIYITPGFLAMELFYYITRIRRKKAWEYGLWSLIITLPIFALMKALEDLLYYPFFSYLPAYILLSWSTAALVAIILSRLYKNLITGGILSKIFKTGILLPYITVYYNTIEKHKNNLFRFTLKTGEIYIGKVILYSLALEEDKEIFIRPAIIVEEENGQTIGKHFFGEGSYINISDVSSIDVLPKELEISI